MARNAKKEKAWLEKRKQHITSTDTASIMGIPGAFGSPMSVYLEKKDLLEKKDREQLQAGIRLQPIILEWYADKLQVAIEHADPYDLVVCEAHPILAASLDARWNDGDRRPVDAKNVRVRDPEEWGEDGSPDIPARYVVQLHQQMLCTGVPVADLAALFAGHDQGWFRIDEDPEITAAIIEADETFWTKHVAADVPPPVDGSDAWTKFLASRKRKLELEEITPELRSSIYALREARAELERFTELEAEAANRIKLAMGDYEVLKGDFGRISFSWSKDREALDLEAYVAELEKRILDQDPGAAPLLQAAKKKLTTTKPGTRSFRPTFKEA